MKLIYSLLTISFLFTFLARGDEPNNTRKWIELSAKSQNLHREILILGPGVGLDPATHEEDLKAVDKALNDLVAAGELVSKKITLIPAGEIDVEILKSLFKSIDPLRKTYGHFVAVEMCDLGARLRFETIKPYESVVLHLRLPKKEMKAFITRVTALKLIAKPKQEKSK